MSSKSIIAISGRSGCGNSSVSRIVAEKLGFRFVNYTFHDMAKEMNIPFEDLLARARTETSYDLALDKKQVEIAMQGKCVLGSRLAIWLLKEHAVTIYLDGTPEVRGTRIANREKKDPGQAIAETVKRDMFDHERFMKLYKIDNDNFSFADLVINTEEGDQHVVAARVLEFLEKPRAIYKRVIL